MFPTGTLVRILPGFLRDDLVPETAIVVDDPTPPELRDAFVGTQYESPSGCVFLHGRFLGLDFDSVVEVAPESFCYLEVVA